MTTASRPGFGQTIEIVYPSVVATRLGAVLGRQFDRQLGTVGRVQLANLLFVPPAIPALLAIYLWRKVAGKKWILCSFSLRSQGNVFPAVDQHIDLAEIRQIAVIPGSENRFFRTASIQIVGLNDWKMVMHGIPNPLRFIEGIRKARAARQQTEFAQAQISARKAAANAAAAIPAGTPVG